MIDIYNESKILAVKYLSKHEHKYKESIHNLEWLNICHTLNFAEYIIEREHDDSIYLTSLKKRIEYLILFHLVEAIKKIKPVKKKKKN